MFSNSPRCLVDDEPTTDVPESSDKNKVAEPWDDPNMHIKKKAKLLSEHYDKLIEIYNDLKNHDFYYKKIESQPTVKERVDMFNELRVKLGLNFTVTEDIVDLKLAQLLYYNEGPLWNVGVAAVNTRRKYLRTSTTIARKAYRKEQLKREREERDEYSD
jgi:hypothetical protein